MIKVPRVDSLPNVWIYENFLDEKFYRSIFFYFDQLKDTLIHNNFEGRVASYNNNTYRIIDSWEHRRYHQLWSLNLYEGYWKQNYDTITQWYKSESKKIIPHVLRNLIYLILQKKPFTDYDGDWIPIRGILNLIKPGFDLQPHVDGNSFVYRGPTFSATYYIDVEGNGGEFWDERGFYYKPKNNALLINEGSRNIHGVRKSDIFRIGVTIRFVKVKDLILSDNIDEMLYKPML